MIVNYCFFVLVRGRSCSVLYCVVLRVEFASGSGDESSASCRAV